ncbi:thiamine pyrophosphate-binding protein [Singulisphaera acidiphila]|uniref:Thiamine pyrophosphate-dependent enzyme, possible carboligase or decarboxylase n=1 Tax=Singulisphaera acidiphila (strain ATCC BAA-1392 / DSM 18658 / VKM B-2454 / MOB10) TaxID=886293 RepID=L0DP81_SINAD|nr:thiamine pyrophosphate-binding protein [Singulisphaera acidiphila]AGA30476.1 thiamine pyrophosphate-dependent enzyme, possible carboligase or decarboxylase [Singulisphaera acidiphila DSM 18658]
MRNGADLLVDGLVRLGFRHLFGMPGSHSTTIYDALRRQGSIATILTRNEQAGAFAADGYARVTGKPGLVCTTAGPGATNALTGVAECWADSVPILLLAGQVNADRIHQECGAYHEVDLESIFRPVTKWRGTARAVDDIPAMLGQAFDAMSRGRPRPTALFLPQDLMRQESHASDSAVVPAVPPSPSQSIPAQAIAEAVALLRGSQRPIILAGGGALWAGAAAEVRAVAERLGAPVVTSLNGKGILDERDPYSLGHARSARAKEALPHADAMLAIGCRFTEVMTDWRRMPVPANLVQIDVDPDQIGMNHPVAVGIEADAKAALTELLRALPEGPTEGWGPIWEQARAARPARPEWLIETLRAVLPESTPVFADACEMGYRLHTDWTSYGPRSLFYPSNYITLGWGFPAALGAAVARGGEPVVSVSGDGGFLMTAQELATATRYRLPVIAIVHNDSSYGAIKNIQQRAHEGRYLDVELNNPDFLKLADAFGVPSARVTDADELRGAVIAALDRQGPTLIEVPDRWRSFRT